MPDALPLAAVRWMRNCGFDEAWIQDYIWENPNCLAACLRLRQLESVMKERRQEGGGRLDLLLKNPENDDMYEVEVTLGDTDADHIIKFRMIEYWDRERRKWPKRKHTAVLVAEGITARFFNVIHLMSWAIPIVAVQASIVEVNGQKALHFIRVLDTYEEPEEPGAEEAVPEDFWRKQYPWVVEIASALGEVVKPICGQLSLKFFRSTLRLTGKYDFFWFYGRVSPKSRMGFSLADNLLENGAALLARQVCPLIEGTTT
jgi:hypothetical protein